ncbi:MAG TPA: GNAT family N-acetyltransferase [Armatimonadota bacterium]
MRLAEVSELEAINDIYNYSVANSTATYQTEPETMAARKAWFAAHDELHPVTVAVDGEAVLGWGSLSQFHPRKGYELTVEDSVYVHHRFYRRGIGRAILTDLIRRASDLGHHTILASISGEQEASIRLHESLGFREAARMIEVGRKFDRWLDLVYLQLMLPDQG